MENNINVNSDFLVGRPSFLIGMASLFDFANALNDYNVSATPQEADAIAMYADWKAVGDDFRFAMHKFSKEDIGK